MHTVCAEAAPGRRRRDWQCTRMARLLFGFFAVIIARLFFPAESQYASLLLTTATFGVGFFMRPVGGILLGIYAGRRG